GLLIPVGAGSRSGFVLQPPDLVFLGAQCAGGIAGPLVDEGSGCGGDIADVDALATVDGHELVVLAVAERGDTVEGEHLVGGAVAGVLDDGGPVGGGGT